MKRLITLTLVLMLAGCAVKAKAPKSNADVDLVTGLPPTTEPVTVAAKEVRVARDVARFHLSWLTENPTDPDEPPYCWIVARIKRYDFFISDTNAGSDYGNTIRYSNEFPQTIIEGSITPLVYLTVRPRIRICDYREVMPMTRVRGEPYAYESIDPYSPFYYPEGGTVICKINDKLDGLERYRPADMIPSSWIDYLIPAISLARKNDALFRSNDAQAKRQLLTAQMKDKNPFIAVDACRRLARADAFDPKDAAEAIYQADPIRSAAILTVIITSVQSNQVCDQFIADLRACVGRARSFDAIRGIAVGISATAIPYGWMSDPLERDPAYDSALKPLVDDIIAKYKPFKTHFPVDDILIASLQRLSDTIDRYKSDVPK